MCFHFVWTRAAPNTSREPNHYTRPTWCSAHVAVKIMVAKVFLHQEVIHPITKHSVIGIHDFFVKNWLHVLELLKLISMISSKRKYLAYEFHVKWGDWRTSWYGLGYSSLCITWMYQNLQLTDHTRQSNREVWLEHCIHLVYIWYTSSLW